AITSGLRPRSPGRSIGTARFTFRRYTPVSVTGSTIRIGVVGYGYWGPNLVRNFAELDGCGVTVIADRRPACREAAARRCPGARIVAGAGEWIGSPGGDAVGSAT